MWHWVFPVRACFTCWNRIQSQSLTCQCKWNIILSTIPSLPQHTCFLFLLAIHEEHISVIGISGQVHGSLLYAMEENFSGSKSNIDRVPKQLWSSERNLGGGLLHSGSLSAVCVPLVLDRPDIVLHMFYFAVVFSLCDFRVSCCTGELPQSSPFFSGF